MTKCYLRVGSDYLEDAQLMPSIKYAKEEFLATAQELARFDQRIEASIHLYDHGVHEAPHCHEYPDYVLGLSDRGALICSRT
jgi:hypothetical protein